MFVAENSRTRAILAQVNYAAKKIKKELPSLQLLKGAQKDGGVYISKPDEKSIKDQLPSPQIFLLNDNPDDTTTETRVTSIDQLLPVADWAKFGNGETTVLDKQVRKTLSIPPSKCRVDWNPHLSHAVAEFGRDVLHLSDANVHHLSAELHNVLIYTEGDFFAPHRDSYKTEGHIGTMSVLVSDFDGDKGSNNNNEIDGGTVYFAVGTELRSWDATKEQPWAGWIGSVRHAVTKVKSGRRVVAVYNLIMKIDDESDERKGVRGKSKSVITKRLSSNENSSRVSSPSSTLYMPGTGPISKMPLAMFHRLIETPHLSLDDLKTLRLVCRAFDDHIGGIVGLLSKSFLAAHQRAEATVCQTLRPRYGVQNLLMILPLRNSYSTGGAHDGLVPPHHLWGSDLLLYEAATMALGKNRVGITPITMMLERNCDDRSYPHPVGWTCIARDIVIPDEKFEEPKKTAKYLGDLDWELFQNETDGDVAVRPCLFPANSFCWGLKREAIKNWKKPKPSGLAAAAAAQAGENDDDDDSSDDDNSGRRNQRCSDTSASEKELSYGQDIALELHECAPCDDSELDYDDDWENYDDDDFYAGLDLDDRDKKENKKDLPARDYVPPVDDPQHLATANPHLRPRRRFETPDSELKTSRRADFTILKQKEMQKHPWLLKLANLRRDPLRKLKPEGYSCGIWGNAATMRLHFFRRCALVFVLGDDGGENNDNTSSSKRSNEDILKLLGPPAEMCYPEGVPCHLVNGEEDCYAYC